jgi:5-methylcytosine-specific restriction endonuclease McrA
MRFFAFVVDRGSFACEALFQNINGFPASRRVVHLLPSEKGAGAQHAPTRDRRRAWFISIISHTQRETKKMSPNIKCTNFLLPRHFVDIGMRKLERWLKKGSYIWASISDVIECGLWRKSSNAILLRVKKTAILSFSFQRKQMNRGN